MRLMILVFHIILTLSLIHLLMISSFQPSPSSKKPSSSSFGRATLIQELIRRMVNTSEMVSNEVRVEIVDKYAEKLMNSEYPLDQTRNILIGGLKGYERLLSLSLDTKNPKWKPLHMSATWNARNRRMAKQRSRTSWYKGKEEVEPPPNPSSQEEGQSSQSSQSSQEEASRSQPNLQEADHGLTSLQATLATSGDQAENMEQEVDGNQEQKAGNKRKKKRGPEKGNITLGGLKKVQTAMKRKAKNKMRKKLMLKRQRRLMMHHFRANFSKIP